MEIFKDVLMYKDLYEVSNIGRVRNKLTGNFLKQSLSKKGYPRVGLYINKQVLTKSVHRLIMDAFNPTMEHASHVNHINGIRDDNRIENLEWVSNRENSTHSISKQIKRTSNYPDVCFSINHGKYMAQVHYNKKNHYLGLFTDEETAYEAVKSFHSKNNIINRYI